jgi:hypothetical protein
VGDTKYKHWHSSLSKICKYWHQLHTIRNWSIYFLFKIILWCFLLDLWWSKEYNKSIFQLIISLKEETKHVKKS